MKRPGRSPPAEEPGGGETLKEVDIEVQHEEQMPEDQKMDQEMRRSDEDLRTYPRGAFNAPEAEEVAEELTEAPVEPSESREDKGGSPRKPGLKRSTDPAERTRVRFKQGLDDMPITPTEPRTRDDAISGVCHPC